MRLLAAFVTGLQEGSQTTNSLGETIYETIATCKHFVGYSVDKMPPRLSFDPNVSQTDLYQYFFPAWEACAKTAVSVMCAYNGINGNPMCMSPMINSVLRQQFNFSARPENYVVTDSGAIDFMVSQFHKFSSHLDAAVHSMNAGVDLNSGNNFVLLKNTTRVSSAQIDAALTRLMHARMAMGLFDAPETIAYSSLGPKDIFNAPHKKLALTMSQKSIVMLKNEGNMMPLSLSGAGAIRSVAVIGWGANDSYAPLANYMGCGYSSWSPRLPNCSIITPLMAIQERFATAGVKVTYTHGCDVENNDTSGFPAATAAAKAADLVIFVGGNRNCEGGQGHGGAHCESEGHDRPDLEMPGVQTQLLKQLHAANKKTVLLALTGGPISMNWEAENLPAIFVIWYGGQMMGTAITDVLVGDVSPAGRSPFTWPTGLSQVPDELDMSPSTPPGRTYRYLQPTPLYTFGYGLTYGRIQYTTASFLDPSSSKITIPLSCKAALPGSTTGAPGCGTITVCAQVTNAKAAAHATEEVVQVYAAPKQGSIHGASL